jgi:hypothetical protein
MIDENDDLILEEEDKNQVYSDRSSLGAVRSLKNDEQKSDSTVFNFPKNEDDH